MADKGTDWPKLVAYGAIGIGGGVGIYYLLKQLTAPPCGPNTSCGILMQSDATALAQCMADYTNTYNQYMLASGANGFTQSQINTLASLMANCTGLHNQMANDAKTQTGLSWQNILANYVGQTVEIVVSVIGGAVAVAILAKVLGGKVIKTIGSAMTAIRSTLVRLAGQNGQIDSAAVETLTGTESAFESTEIAQADADAASLVASDILATAEQAAFEDSEQSAVEGIGSDLVGFLSSLA